LPERLAGNRWQGRYTGTRSCDTVTTGPALRSKTLEVPESEVVITTYLRTCRGGTDGLWKLLIAPSYSSLSICRSLIGREASSVLGVRIRLRFLWRSHSCARSRVKPNLVECVPWESEAFLCPSGASSTLDGALVWVGGFVFSVL
jgi:hypothetical protein